MTHQQQLIYMLKYAGESFTQSVGNKLFIGGATFEFTINGNLQNVYAEEAEEDVY